MTTGWYHPNKVSVGCYSDTYFDVRVREQYHGREYCVAVKDFSIEYGVLAKLVNNETLERLLRHLTDEVLKYFISQAWAILDARAEKRYTKWDMTMEVVS